MLYTFFTLSNHNKFKPEISPLIDAQQSYADFNVVSCTHTGYAREEGNRCEVQMQFVCFQPSLIYSRNITFCCRFFRSQQTHTAEFDIHNSTSALRVGLFFEKEKEYYAIYHPVVSLTHFDPQSSSSHCTTRSLQKRFSVNFARSQLINSAREHAESEYFFRVREKRRQASDEHDKRLSSIDT